MKKIASGFCENFFSISGVSPDNNVKMLQGDDFLRETIVTLSGFLPRFRDSVAYGLDSLARKIIEHCLPSFIMGNCPEIVLKDNEESIVLNDYFKETYEPHLNQVDMDFMGEKYSLYHMFLTQGVNNHELHLCANNREVKPIDLSKKIPNLEKSKKLTTENGAVYYVGYLAGDYLDQAINVERSEFQFDDLPLLGKNRGASIRRLVPEI